MDIFGCHAIPVSRRRFKRHQKPQPEPVGCGGPFDERDFFYLFYTGFEGVKGAVDLAECEVGVALHHSGTCYWTLLVVMAAQKNKQLGQETGF
jgi:hypothetical protein